MGRAVATALATGCLTPEGRRFVNGMATGLGPLRRQPVTPRAEGVADLVAADHAVAWRLRNVAPPPEEVDRWASAWLAGRRCPPLRPAASLLADGGGAIASDRRLSLARRLLVEPDGGRESAEIDAADLLLLSRRWEPAAEAYDRRLGDRPDDAEVWAGLALASGRTGGPAASSFSTCPENVAALHRAVRQRTGAAPDPVALATWFAEGRGRG